MSIPSRPAWPPHYKTQLHLNEDILFLIHHVVSVHWTSNSLYKHLTDVYWTSDTTRPYFDHKRESLHAHKVKCQVLETKLNIVFHWCFRSFKNSSQFRRRTSLHNCSSKSTKILLCSATRKWKLVLGQRNTKLEQPQTGETRRVCTTMPKTSAGRFWGGRQSQKPNRKNNF